MENWQFMFVNFAIGGFIFQIILIACVYLVSKSLLKEKTNRELLESIYKHSSFSGDYFRNLRL